MRNFYSLLKRFLSKLDQNRQCMVPWEKPPVCAWGQGRAPDVPMPLAPK